MIGGLIGLIILVIIVGIVVYLLTLLIDMLPMDARFLHIAKILLILVAFLIVLARALPLLGLSLSI
jgi:hypothetical protein